MFQAKGLRTCGISTECTRIDYIYKDNTPAIILDSPGWNTSGFWTHLRFTQQLAPPPGSTQTVIRGVIYPWNTWELETVVSSFKGYTNPWQHPYRSRHVITGCTVIMSSYYILYIFSQFFSIYYLRCRTFPWTYCLLFVNTFDISLCSPLGYRQTSHRRKINDRKER